MDLFINNLQTNDTYKGDCVLDFNNVKNASLINIDFLINKIPWMNFKGSETEKIFIRLIDKIEGENLIKSDKSVNAGALKH